MNGRLTLTAYGDPVPQGRPRFARMGNHVRAYDPGKSRSWKDDVKWQVLEQVGPVPPLEGPLRLQLHFHLRRPASLPKKVLHHVKKPDVDNLAKAVKDALRGIVYRDDSQVVELVVRKQYVLPSDRTRVNIGVERIPIDEEMTA